MSSDRTGNLGAPGTFEKKQYSAMDLEDATRRDHGSSPYTFHNSYMHSTNTHNAANLRFA
jgi:hypothetical protein